MKELPIIYSTPMIQAKLAGYKTMTRRLTGLKVINEEPDKWTVKYPFKRPGVDAMFALFVHSDGTEKIVRSPYRVGDLMYSREKWCRSLDNEGEFYYFATEPQAEDDEGGSPWKPSIHMPKVAARLWDRCTSVKIERLKDISEEDAIAEGIEPDVTQEGWYYNYAEVGYRYVKPIQSFLSLFASLHGKEIVELNPWVFVFGTEPVEHE